MIVDSRPIAVDPPSMTASIRVSRSAITCGASVGLTWPERASPLSPGLLASHYAPAAAVRLDARDIRPGEAALLFGRTRPRGVASAVAALNLSASGDLAEAAANLFAHLRALDARLAGLNGAGIAVAPIPSEGLGEAINDRLRRAAAER